MITLVIWTKERQVNIDVQWGLVKWKLRLLLLGTDLRGRNEKEKPLFQLKEANINITIIPTVDLLAEGQGGLTRPPWVVLPSVVE